MVERGRVPSFIDESASSPVKVQLTQNLKALFHKEEKLWTVVENDHVVDGTLALTGPVEDQTLNTAIPKDAARKPTKRIQLYPGCIFIER